MTPCLHELRDNAVHSENHASLANDLLSPNPLADAARALMDAALALARYSGAYAAPPLKPIVSAALKRGNGIPPGVEEQQTLLVSLLLSPRPDLGLELLNAGGFIAKHWPELATLSNVDHSKDFPPKVMAGVIPLKPFVTGKPLIYASHSRFSCTIRVSRSPPRLVRIGLKDTRNSGSA